MTGTAIDFAKKLNTLFEKKTKRDGSKYTQEQVIQGTDGVLTRAYLWKLRTGRAKNPGFYIVQALADFFEVDINYFRVDEGEEEELLEKALRKKLVNEVALRASMYSEETVLAIIHMMDFIEKNRTATGETAGELSAESRDEGRASPASTGR
jgi:transcriptional regulator with XRE-family HTH domain